MYLHTADYIKPILHCVLCTVSMIKSRSSWTRSFRTSGMSTKRLSFTSLQFQSSTTACTESIFRQPEMKTTGVLTHNFTPQIVYFKNYTAWCQAAIKGPCLKFSAPVSLSYVYVQSSLDLLRYQPYKIFFIIKLTLLITQFFIFIPALCLWFWYPFVDVSCYFIVWL